MIHEFANWLSETKLSLMLQDVLWVIPTSQSIHIICVGLVFGSAIMINLRLLGVSSHGRTVRELVESVLPWMWGGLAGLLVTGSLQTIAEPMRQFKTPFFWSKMLMIVIVASMTAIFAHVVRANAARWDRSPVRSAGASAFALASTMLWMAIVMCGRFIGYS